MLELGLLFGALLLFAGGGAAAARRSLTPKEAERKHAQQQPKPRPRPSSPSTSSPIEVEAAKQAYQVLNADPAPRPVEFRPVNNTAPKPQPKPQPKPGLKPDAFKREAPLVLQQDEPMGTRTAPFVAMPAAKPVAQKTVAPPAKPSELPAGYDPKRASEMAPAVAREVKSRGRKYNRDVVRAYQRLAGLKQDGLYGPKTRQSLIYYHVPPANVPAAIY